MDYWHWLRNEQTVDRRLKRMIIELIADLYDLKWLWTGQRLKTRPGHGSYYICCQTIDGETSSKFRKDLHVRALLCTVSCMLASQILGWLAVVSATTTLFPSVCWQYSAGCQWRLCTQWTTLADHIIFTYLCTTPPCVMIAWSFRVISKVRTLISTIHEPELQ